MNNAPLISIITPSLNQSRFIEQTILSVLNQTYTNIQYIIIDGASTDNTMKIVNRYKDKIDTIVSEKDRGQADAINKGFALAKGELVGWINSDDILYPDCVEKIVDLNKKNKEAVIYYHSFNDIINEFDEVQRTYQHIIPNKRHLVRTNYDVIQQGSFYNRKMVEKVGYLDVTNFYCMDLDLWLKLLDYGEIVHTKDSPHAAFRIYPGTKTDTGKEKFLQNIHQVLKKNNAKLYYKTIWHKIYLYYLKAKIKKIICQ